LACRESFFKKDGFWTDPRSLTDKDRLCEDKSRNERNGQAAVKAMENSGAKGIFMPKLRILVISLWDGLFFFQKNTDFLQGYQGNSTVNVG
jgi:hypothetical protein